ncbi:arginase family protein [Couchioplanes caeruleus]|uniref:arginase family protein n=1 Tax=Couchioplanes caeruleus TaxID=56438 RepID=UPI00201B9D12|nr:arginase family protein [Couchioplanes caeruleus]UQU68007.1 arginase family protein [Couchioplanes caeruleus]
MATIVVPYHHDDRLPDGLIPAPGGEPPTVVGPELPAGDRWARMAVLHEAVAATVAGSPLPVTVLSGDCLVGLAVLTGAQRAGLDPALIWFDAHGDVHTLETTSSGYLGGLSLRLAMGAHPELLAERSGMRPVPEERVVLVGARDLDPPEAAYLATSRVRRSAVAGLSAADLPEGPLIVHVDVDVVDSGELPGLLFPAPGGPAGPEVAAAVARIRATGRVAVLDIACTWQPAGEPRERAELIAALVGAGEPG